ncbi:hypothetical protein T484DRAFT_1756658 [Baffinella frigidus]|nr:hypothetical protein T484DRAFT_1756658 [Cryptophyta sp. CCMP2293]
MASPVDGSKYFLSIARFGVTSLNFCMTVVFVSVLLTNAFTMKGITAPQVFYADRVLQSSSGVTPMQLDQFIKNVYGMNTEILGIVNKTTILPTLLPSMYEISGANSMLRIDAVHSNFMLFSALWIASAFALAMTQVPSIDPLTWGYARVIVVHAWNFIGLIITIVIFTSTTKWSNIPTSNLFYALVGQIMAWTYQYFHMVECSQIVKGSLAISHHPTAVTVKDDHLSTMFSIEMRKLIYMEFSVVVPMLLVSSIMPGSIGLDEWRIQTVLFSSWTLFALLGLHLRFRKSLVTDVIIADGAVNDENEDTGVPDEHGLDALGYLTYAIILVFCMLLNAMGTTTFEDLSYAPPRITQSRIGARFIILVCAVLVAETIYKSVRMRFFPLYLGPFQKPPGGAADSTETSILTILPSFLVNMAILAVGSFLVKVLIFSGLSDVNGLSTWYPA